MTLHHALIGACSQAAGGPKTYATLDPAAKGDSLVLSNGDLSFANTTITFAHVRATIGKPVSDGGKWYMEAHLDTLSFDGASFVGMANNESNLNNFMGISGGDSLGVRNYTGTAQRYWWNSGVTGNWMPLALQGATIMILLDFDEDKLKLGVDGVWGGVPIDIAPSLMANNSVEKKVYPAFCLYSTPSLMTVNFGATPFTYSPPAGANAGWYSQ